MSKVKFTPEQQQMLRENPYTIHVTADVLSISKEFKEIFYKEYLSGALPRDILQKYGYPADVLGKQRIWGISHCIRKRFEETGEFSDIRTHGCRQNRVNTGGEDPPVGASGKLSDPRSRVSKKISLIRSTRK